MKIIDAATLNGREGFALSLSASAGGAFGRSVAIAGDVNGDGLDDLLIGLPLFWEDGDRRGESFLVYGKLGRRPFDGRMDPLAPDGADGVRIKAVGDVGWEQSGWSVAGAGDLNADGIDDFVIGAIGNGGSGSGRAHVIFGREGGFGPALELGSLGPDDGFVFEGSRQMNLGVSVAAAGDVNGDGVDDLAVGQSRSGFNDAALFVVYGRRGGGFAETLLTDDIDGESGLRFESTGSRPVGFGRSVASAGDFDGDGRADLIVGAPGNFFGLGREGGAVHVIFGEDQSAPTLPPPPEDPALRDPFAPGAELIFFKPGDSAGTDVDGGGDVNGDGFDDVIIGVPQADFGGAPLTALGEPLNTGSVFVLFGGPGHAEGETYVAPPFEPGPLERLMLRQDGLQAMRIDGERSRDGLGAAVAIVGDVNGDGIDDFALGAPDADPHGRFEEGSGEWGDGAVYVIYGRAGGFPGLLDLGALRPEQGFRIDGPEGGRDVDGSFGVGVAGGDLNGDGLADVVVQTSAPGGRETAQVYVIYGFHAPTNGDDRLLGGQLRDRIDGRGGDDVIVGRGAADALKGGRGADVLRGGGGRDALEGDGGRDLLKGGGGRDALRGGGGGDDLQGEGGVDRLFGGGGGDVLAGGRGRDVLIGGGGRDVFLFQGRSGMDVIRDFQQGRDLIEIASAARFGELELEARRGGVEIGFDGGSVLVRGASLKAFDADDFVF